MSRMASATARYVNRLWEKINCPTTGRSDRKPISKGLKTLTTLAGTTTTETELFCRLVPRKLATPVPKVVSARPDTF